MGSSTLHNPLLYLVFIMGIFGVMLYHGSPYRGAGRHRKIVIFDLSLRSACTNTKHPTENQGVNTHLNATKFLAGTSLMQITSHRDV
jgi:hypothetical protein